MTTSTIYGIRIRALRLERGWSQEQLAELAGLHPRTIQRVESGKECGRHTLLSVAKALGIDIKELTSPDEKAFEDRPRVKFVPRVRYGNEIIEVVAGSHLFSRGNDPLRSEEEVELVGAFVQDVHETCEIWDQMQAKHHIESEYRFTQMIEELDQLGFHVFASRGSGSYRTARDADPIPMSLATVLVLRRDNPAIVKLPSGVEAVATPLITEQRVGSG